jgi:acyl-CoA thioesterase
VRNVVFGGQILAQMIMAAHTDRGDDKKVKSIHAIFARAGDYTQPIRYFTRAM